MNKKRISKTDIVKLLIKDCINEKDANIILRLTDEFFYIQNDVLSFKLIDNEYYINLKRFKHYIKVEGIEKNKYNFNNVFNLIDKSINYKLNHHDDDFITMQYINGGTK